MTHSVMAVLTRPVTARAVLETARMVAERINASELKALHVRHDPMEGFLPSEEVMTPERKQAIEAAEAKKSAAIKAVFERWAGDSGQSAKADWVEVTGPVEQAVADIAARTNLVAVGHPSDGRDPDASAALHALLFKSRIPVLLAPLAPPACVGRHVAVAWKRNEPTERAIQAALPLLLKANRVTMLLGDEEADPASFPAAIVDKARAAGIPIDIREFATAPRNIGAALLHETRSCGADLLVMGAFAHGRLRELILGGATEEILRGADLPVLLRH
jgi:nucleotide-binding universal stress UspA family protein